MFDQNGMWVEDTYHHPGDLGSSISQMANVFTSNDLANQHQADVLNQRYLTQGANPQLEEGFQGTPQGQQALNAWHMDPETGAAAISSSPWGRERTAFKDYDPSTDDSGEVAANIMRESGDIKGYAEAEKSVRANARASAAQEKADTAAYQRQLAEVTKEYSNAYLKAMWGGASSDDAQKIGLVASPGYALLHPEDKVAIDARLKSVQVGPDGKPLPGAQSLIDQRYAKVDNLGSSTNLNDTKANRLNELTPEEIKLMDSRIGVNGASANYLKVKTDNYSNDELNKFTQSAIKASANAASNPQDPAARKLADALNSKLQGIMDEASKPAPTVTPVVTGSTIPGAKATPIKNPSTTTTGAGAQPDVTPPVSLNPAVNAGATPVPTPTPTPVAPQAAQQGTPGNWIEDQFKTPQQVKQALKQGKIDQKTAVKILHDKFVHDI
jgi:hypothetical protein